MQWMHRYNLIRSTFKDEPLRSLNLERLSNWGVCGLNSLIHVKAKSPGYVRTSRGTSSMNTVAKSARNELHEWSLSSMRYRAPNTKVHTWATAQYLWKYDTIVYCGVGHPASAASHRVTHTITRKLKVASLVGQSLETCTEIHRHFWGTRWSRHVSMLPQIITARIN